jgi:hypothetical protein
MKKNRSLEEIEGIEMLLHEMERGLWPIDLAQKVGYSWEHFAILIISRTLHTEIHTTQQYLQVSHTQDL